MRDMCNNVEIRTSLRRVGQFSPPQKVYFQNSRIICFWWTITDPSWWGSDYTIFTGTCVLKVQTFSPARKHEHFFTKSMAKSITCGTCDVAMEAIRKTKMLILNGGYCTSESNIVNRWNSFFFAEAKLGDWIALNAACIFVPYLLGHSDLSLFSRLFLCLIASHDISNSTFTVYYLSVSQEKEIFCASINNDGEKRWVTDLKKGELVLLLNILDTT